MAVSGELSFPASTDRVGAKRALKTAADSGITVEAYTLDGVKVASVNPTYDDAAATRIYSYAISNLRPNVDYVIKVTSGNVVLKKLIPKANASAGNLPAQTVDAISTAAVIIASQKLSHDNVTITLGDKPTGATVADLSAAIDATVKPVLLEQSISAAINGGTAGITAQTANYANVFNVVVTALVEQKSPETVFAGGDKLNEGVPIFVVSGTTVTTPSTDATTWQIPSASDVTTIAATTAQGYTAPTNSAKTYDGFAAQYLAAQDIANASLNYEKALAIDPNDKEANFGGAITSGLMLMQDPDISAIVAKWGVVMPTVSQVIQGASPIKVPFTNMTSMPISSSVSVKSVAKSAVQPGPSAAPQAGNAQQVLAAFKALQGKLPQQKAGFTSVAKRFAKVPVTAPTVSEMQTVIDNVIIPKIDTILGRLAKVEGSNYSFTVTPAMQGNPQYGTPVVLNDGEFYTLDAALNIFQTIFKIATAYNFDLPSGYTYDTISQDPLAMINSTSVFTLKADGTAKMNAALVYAKVAATKVSNSYDAVKNRAAGVGAFDITSWSAADRANFTSTLSQVQAGLAGPTTITIGDKSVSVDATKFFTNPLTRKNLPTFGYDVTRDATLSAKYGKPTAGETTYQSGWVNPTYCDIVPKTDIPDYTLNGILPGNSAANNVAGFNAILPVVDGKVLKNSGNDYNYFGNRCSTDGTYVYFLTYSNTINKIDLATGTVIKLVDLTNQLQDGTYVYPNSIVYVNGSLYVTAYIYKYDNTTNTSTNSYNFYQVNTTTNPGSLTYVSGLPVTSSNYWSYIGAVTSNGSDVYYVVNSYDQLTYKGHSDIYKASGLGTASLSKTLLFSDADSQCWKLAVNGNYVYTDSSNVGLLKSDMKGNTVASYDTPGIGWSVLVGNNLYGISDSKIIKYGNL